MPIMSSAHLQQADRHSEQLVSIEWLSLTEPGFSLCDLSGHPPLFSTAEEAGMLHAPLNGESYSTSLCKMDIHVCVLDALGVAYAFLYRFL